MNILQSRLIAATTENAASVHHSRQSSPTDLISGIGVNVRSLRRRVNLCAYGLDQAKKWMDQTAESVDSAHHLATSTFLFAFDL